MTHIAHAILHRFAYNTSVPSIPDRLPCQMGDGQFEDLRMETPKPHGAYELKFLIDEERAQRIMSWARSHLNPDPHAGGEQGDAYLVNSLYLDTPNLDVFHRSELFRQRKYRLRRYGSESRIWLEVKRKRRGLVRKHRVSIDDHRITQHLTEPADTEWDGAWFRQRLDELALRPVCQVTYERFARVGTTTSGTMRLTIDSNLNGCLASAWQVPSGPLNEVCLLENHRILELKFQVVMPLLFRRLVEQERLLTTAFSKYRTSVEECVPLDWIAGDWIAGDSISADWANDSVKSSRGIAP